MFSRDAEEQDPDTVKLTAGRAGESVCNNRAVEVPGRVPEHRHHDDQSEEKRRHRYPRLAVASFDSVISQRPSLVRTRLSAGGKWISNHRYPHARDALTACRGLSAETRVRVQRQYDQSEGKRPFQIISGHLRWRQRRASGRGSRSSKPASSKAVVTRELSWHRVPPDADHPIGRGSVPQPGRSAQLKQKTRRTALKPPREARLEATHDRNAANS